MTVQPIRLFGDPVLRTPAEAVVDFDRELRKLVADLTETMQDEGGAGLAAPQLGVSLRVFAFDVDDVVGHIVNPVLSFPDDEGPGGAHQSCARMSNHRLVDSSQERSKTPAKLIRDRPARTASIRHTCRVPTSSADAPLPSSARCHQGAVSTQESSSSPTS